MLKRIVILPTLILTSFLFAQIPQIEVSGVTYQSVGSAPDTFRIFFQSLTGQPISVRSASLSVLHNSSCSNYGGVHFSLFQSLWNQYFQSIQVSNLATPISPSPAAGTSYNRRLLYANVSFSTPPAFVVAPVAPARVEVISFLFNGLCTDKLYVEDRSEFLANQLGDAFNNNIPFRVLRNPTLPVEYGALSAEAVNNNQVDINWTTLRENNSAYFEIEKAFSADFLESEVVGQVQAAVYSESETNYSFTDRSAMAPVVYYRLRQVDLDGQVELSSSMSVNFGELSSLSLNAYPNPFDDQLIVEVNKGSAGRYSMRLMDMTGKVLSETVSETSNITQHRWDLKLGHLPRGSYFIQVAELGGQGRRRVLKLIK